MEKKMSMSRKVQAFSEYTLSLHRKASTNILVIISMCFFFLLFLAKTEVNSSFLKQKINCFENIWLCGSMCRQNTRHKEKPKESGDRSTQTS